MPTDPIRSTLGKGMLLDDSRPQSLQLFERLERVVEKLQQKNLSSNDHSDYLWFAFILSGSLRDWLRVELSESRSDGNSLVDEAIKKHSCVAISMEISNRLKHSEKTRAPVLGAAIISKSVAVNVDIMNLSGTDSCGDFHGAGGKITNATHVHEITLQDGRTFEAEALVQECVNAWEQVLCELNIV